MVIQYPHGTATYTNPDMDSVQDYCNEFEADGHMVVVGGKVTTGAIRRVDFTLTTHALAIRGITMDDLRVRDSVRATEYQDYDGSRRFAPLPSGHVVELPPY